MITTINKILIKDMIAIRKKITFFYRIGSPPFCIFSYSFGKQHLFISETIKKATKQPMKLPASSKVDLIE